MSTKQMKKSTGEEGRRDLVIVESPAKARAIGNYLGKGFEVVASVGHVRDLPKKELGVDPEEGFEPTYEVIYGKKKIVDQIRKAARRSNRVYVATDPDREGEAIAWHIVDEAKIPLESVRRATFYEITPGAVREAIAAPGGIDTRKVDSQQARRILDRLVGYRISPLLSEPFYPGLSAGRVQTVALRLVVEREMEIESFQKVAYWRVLANVAAGAEGDEKAFVAELQRVDGVHVLPKGQPGEKRYRAPALGSEEQANEVVARAREAEWVVSRVEKKEGRRTPSPPFTTSTLQMEASRRLRMSARRTMRLAQRLYEGVEVDGEPVGLITYMRTDSTRVSPAAINEARSVIGERFGERFLPDKPNFYRSRAGAQEAHEAIRPTSAARSLEKVRRVLAQKEDGKDLYRLYELVWLRFVASQMPPAVFDRSTVDFVVDENLEFKASGSVLRFPGFIKAYSEAGKAWEAGDDVLLPSVDKGQRVDVVEVRYEGKETQPPARYSDATLVKELEAQGIGRPSTYAAIISRLFDRNYAEREGRRMRPTFLGRYVLRYLLHHFDDIFEVGFTRGMEEELDKIEEGTLEWRQVVRDMWEPLSEDIMRLEAEDGKELDEEDWSDLEPPECPTDPDHGTMKLKWNRFGPFWGCREYPKCRKTEPIPGLGPEPPDEPCPNCGGELLVKRGRFGPFVGCENYRGGKGDCDFTMNVGQDPNAVWAERLRAREHEKDLDRVCPDCGEGQLKVRSGRYGSFIGCSNYPKCRHTEPLPTGIVCPKCGAGDLVERRSGRGRSARRFYGCNRYPECDYTQKGIPRAVECPTCGHAVAEAVAAEGEETLRCPSCKEEVPEPAGSTS